MKVALLKGRMDRLGGIEKYTLRLAEAFHRHGLEVSLVTSNRDSLKLNTPATIHSIGAPLKTSHKELQRFDKASQSWLKDHPHEVVFGMDRHSFQTHYRAGNGVHAAYLRQRELVDSKLKCWSFNWNPLHNLILKMEKGTYESPLVRAMFTNSEMVREEVLEYYRADPERIHVVHNGVEWKEMEADFEAWPQRIQQLRSKKGLLKKPFTFLFVGQGYRRKGLSFLLQGLALLKEDWQLAVVGKDKHTEAFLKQAKHLGLADRIHFFGAQTDVRSFYQLADALVIPSTYDPFANVTLEALAMGLFVVSSRFNGGCEVLTPDNGDLIEELTDPESICQSLQEAIGRPKTEASSQVIRQSVKHLDFEHQLEKMVQITLQTA